MRHLVSAAAVALAATFGAMPAHGDEHGLKVMPDGNDMQWTPAPANLPKGMMWTMLSGDPSKPGPFTEICKRHGVVRLDVFGSASRGTDFDPSEATPTSSSTSKTDMASTPTSD